MYLADTLVLCLFYEPTGKRKNMHTHYIIADKSRVGVHIAVFIEIHKRKIKDFIDTIKEGVESFGGILGDDGIIAKFGDVLDGVKDALDSFVAGLKISSILMIAVAIALLANAIDTLAIIEPKDIAKSVAAIAALMVILNAGFASLAKALAKYKPSGTVKAAIAMIGMAAAINILADAMLKIADLSWSELARGLTGVAGGLALLVAAIKLIGDTKIKISTSIAILALAEACKILADALTKFSKLSWDEIGRGLTAMGGALGELVAALAILSKVGGGGALLGSAGIWIAVQSLDEIS